MDSTEKGFHQDLAAALRDGDHDGWSVTARIYADWLDEQGHETRAGRLRRAVDGKRAPGVRWPHPRHVSGLTHHQRQQLTVALSRPLGILAGTPGTGKTYCAVQLIRSLARHRTLVGSICAPTGKAAVRLNAMLELSWARTIHQLLGVSRNGHDDKGWGFIHNAAHPLHVNWLIVDEASMLDTDLAAALFAALRPGTHVLLVGDPNQLPPVGHGAPLRDMIAAGVPCGKLTEIQRHAGHIVEACAAIQAGEPWEPSAIWAPTYHRGDDGGNLLHHECATASEQLACLRSRLIALRELGHDPVWDVQVLAAVNTRGELSRQNLNVLMQRQLNDDAEGTAEGRWLVGDKVVCLRNHWAQQENGRRAHHDSTVYVANGETAEVRLLHPAHAVVTLTSPARVIRVPLPADKPDDSDEDCRNLWNLAYALTAHKAQGSEWPVVILMIDASSAARQICTREWVYTALSRGKERVITIGKLSVLKQMCKRVSLDQRKTFLMELLGNGMRKS